MKTNYTKMFHYKNHRKQNKTKQIMDIENNLKLKMSEIFFLYIAPCSLRVASP